MRKDVDAESFHLQIQVYFKMLKEDNNKTGQMQILNITVLLETILVQ